MTLVSSVETEYTRITEKILRESRRMIVCKYTRQNITLSPRTENRQNQETQHTKSDAGKQYGVAGSGNRGSNFSARQTALPFNERDVYLARRRKQRVNYILVNCTSRARRPTTLKYHYYGRGGKCARWSQRIRIITVITLLNTFRVTRLELSPRHVRGFLHRHAYDNSTSFRAGLFELYAWQLWLRLRTQDFRETAIISPSCYSRFGGCQRVITAINTQQAIAHRNTMAFSVVVRHPYANGRRVLTDLIASFAPAILHGATPCNAVSFTRVNKPALTVKKSAFKPKCASIVPIVAS